jgi:hypothetical protein
MDERRVLGVLVEKALTTPDVVPMSINALVTGCNQKSNRDPILELSDVEVEEALSRLQKRCWAIKITGGRVIRWRHDLYEAWKVTKPEVAIVAELLLRGPQTEGELRGRASRMAPIEDLDSLRNVLRPLAQRGLVVYLTPEERRGAMLTHGFHAPDELEHLRGRFAGHGTRGSEEPETRAAVPHDVAGRLAEMQSELTQLRAQVTAQAAELARLSEQVRTLREALGM